MSKFSWWEGYWRIIFTLYQGFTLIWSTGPAAPASGISGDNVPEKLIKLTKVFYRPTSCRYILQGTDTIFWNSYFLVLKRSLSSECFFLEQYLIKFNDWGCSIGAHQKPSPFKAFKCNFFGDQVGNDWLINLNKGKGVSSISPSIPALVWLFALLTRVK